MFLKQLKVGHMGVFAYILADTENSDGLIIDPGAEVDSLIAEAGKVGIRIRYIVNTHGHVDHIAGNAELKEKTGAEILIHEQDATMMISHHPIIMRMFKAKPSPPADRMIRDNDHIEVGNLTLQVLHTPGHSPGSISLYTPGYVLTGDTLLPGFVGSTNLIGGSWEDMEKSLREKLLPLPDDTVILPGHQTAANATSTIAYEKLHNPFLT